MSSLTITVAVEKMVPGGPTKIMRLEVTGADGANLDIPPDELYRYVCASLALDVLRRADEAVLEPGCPDDVVPASLMGAAYSQVVDALAMAWESVLYNDPASMGAAYQAVREARHKTTSQSSLSDLVFGKE